MRPMAADDLPRAPSKSLQPRAHLFLNRFSTGFMSNQIKCFYEFGPFRIDTVNRQLLRDGELVPLKAKAVETLLALIEHNGEVVEKDDLMKWLWPDSFVEEANLTQNIYMLRKALGESGYIETVPRRGYKFAAEVKEWEEIPSDLIVIKEKTTARVSYEEETDDSFEAEPKRLSLEAKDYQALTGIERVGAQAVLQLPQVESTARPHGRRKVWLAAAFVAGLILIGIIAFRLYSSSLPFEKVKLTRFTTTGKAVKAAISPDGKYLAYVLSDAGQQSIWLRQIATGKDLQLVSPLRTDFDGLTFSHDGSYVYYVSQEMNHLGVLFQVPSLGGTPTKLAEDVDSPVTLSPDDKRLAFIRFSPTDRSIIIANTDGTEEKRLASTSQGASFRIGVTVSPPAFIPPAWSPDGKTIACPVMITDGEGEYQSIWGFPTDGGAGRPLAFERWQSVGRMDWLADGSGLLTIAAELGANSTQQIWYISYPKGAARRVTNDLSDYRDLSLTTDAKTLIAVQSKRRANIQVAQSSDMAHPRQLTNTNYDGLGGISWTPDGKLVYTLQAGGEQNLWLTGLDSGEPKQLTAHAGLNRQPVVSPDGRYIVFVSNRTGRYHLWRIDADGKHPQELTHGAEDGEPDFSLDSQSVIYRSMVSGTAYLFRVAITGGEPVRLTDKTSGLPAVSPDGKLIAFYYRTAPAAKNQIAIMPIAGGEPKLICDLPAHYGQLHWMPDGSAIAFADRQSEQGNIWSQPLDGGPAKQLTYWRPDPIFSFNWSRDGRWLAYADGALTSDVILISDTGR